MIPPVRKLVRSIASRTSTESVIDDGTLFSSDSTSFSQWTNSQFFDEEPQQPVAPPHMAPPSSFTFTFTSHDSFGLRTKRTSLPHLKRKPQSGWTIDSTTHRRCASENDPYYYSLPNYSSSSHGFTTIGSHRRKERRGSQLNEQNLNISPIEVDAILDAFPPAVSSNSQPIHPPAAQKKAKFGSRGFTTIRSGAQTVKSLLPGRKKYNSSSWGTRTSNDHHWAQAFRIHLRPINPFHRAPKVRPSPFANMPYDIPFFDPAPRRPRSLSA